MPEPTSNERSVGEVEFIEQMTRKLMVDFCHIQLTLASAGQPVPAVFTENDIATNPYSQLAVKKGWVSKDGIRVLSEGWKTAARFLKR